MRLSRFFELQTVWHSNGIPSSPVLFFGIPKRCQRLSCLLQPSSYLTARSRQSRQKTRITSSAMATTLAPGQEQWLNAVELHYREQVTKNRINMGLGTYPELSLANARKKVMEARELLAQGIDPKAQCNAAGRSQTSGDGTYVRERGHCLVRAEEGLRHAGVRRRHLTLAHAACISDPENNTTLKNQCPHGHRTASPD